jgi:hypothetical protein
LSKITTVFVYLIGMQGTDYVKIGVAGDVQDRLRGLQGANPYPLVVLGTFEHPGRYQAFAHEHELHEAYSEWRVRGEWFKLPEKVLARDRLYGLHSLDERKFSSDPGLRTAVDGRRAADCLDEATIRF